MEDDRKGKPAAVIGGMYAKAKQRVLNKMGKRTSKSQQQRPPNVNTEGKSMSDHF